MTEVQSADKLRARMQNIDPYEFEHFVADLWEDRGWTTEVSAGSNDMGVDIEAHKSDGLVDQKLAIQAKRYADGNKVGRPEIQQYYTLKEQDTEADAAVVVTTSSFASTAEDWAREHNVKLVDGEDLVELIDEHDRHDLLDEYAPDITSEAGGNIDPTDAATIDTTVELPEPLQDQENRKKGALLLAVSGLVVWANPWNSPLPMPVFGMALLVGSVVFYAYLEEAVAAVVGESQVLQQFRNGAELMEKNGTVKYKPADERDQVTFDDFDSLAMRRRQGNVYGELDQQFSAGVPNAPSGSIPTNVASKGEETIAAYRFAVHGETPEDIASEMGMSQQDLVASMNDVAGVEFDSEKAAA
ncbi:restriction endonuclease [Halorientalis brevis]|uniref:Restriction endonuclease n=1 Tax=Halorientalis brevis TaxID=1126241 RepID=A0ABD6CG05_9EURY|nr:restriction endonuclease [Halorientalis brevis]